MSRRRATAPGFTLIEMIVTMTLLAIVAGMVAVFMRAPINAYVDSSRRAQMTDLADTAMRRIARDVRLAVPNSVRVSGTFLEFVPSTDGGRYRAWPSGPSGTENILDFDTTSPLDTSFEILQPVGSGTARVNAANGDFIVIFNTGQASGSGCASNPGADVFEGCNRRTLSAAVSGDTLSFTAGAAPFPFRSEAGGLSIPQPQRFQIVPASGPVTFACENIGTSGNDGTGTLKRYSGYGFNASQVTSGLGTGVPLANYLSECSFTYDQTTHAATSSNGLVILKLKLTRSDESIGLVHQIHVNNIP